MRIKTDVNNNIISIYGAFNLADVPNGITVLDENGHSYEQSNGYTKPLVDLEHGMYNYKFVDGVLVEIDNSEEIESRRIQKARSEEISRLKDALKEMDYIGVKIATGRATREEYAEQIALMVQYADRINELEALT